MRGLPFLRPAAVAAAALALGAVALAWRASGGAIASPGALSSAHAELARRCAACHPGAWARATTSDRCVACHDDVAGELAGRRGIHGRLAGARRCLRCHTEHGGPAAGLTRAVPFPHDDVGFSLRAHRRTAAGEPFTCADCHAADLGRFPAGGCADCHRRHQAPFVAAHTAAWGGDCGACHDGVDAFGQGRFDHAPTGFALTGAHLRVSCADCHLAPRLIDAPTTCRRCHAEPADHLGVLGAECGACHGTASWKGATFAHRFPLDHGDGGRVACATCHPEGWRTTTCTGCHEHSPAELAREHREEGIRDWRDCVRCHPTGREHEGRGGDGDEDDD